MKSILICRTCGGLIIPRSNQKRRAFSLVFCWFEQVTRARYSGNPLLGKGPSDPISLDPRVAIDIIISCFLVCWPPLPFSVFGGWGFGCPLSCLARHRSLILGCPFLFGCKSHHTHTRTHKQRSPGPDQCQIIFPLTLILCSLINPRSCTCSFLLTHFFSLFLSFSLSFFLSSSSFFVEPHPPHHTHPPYVPHSFTPCHPRSHSNSHSHSHTGSPSSLPSLFPLLPSKSPQIKEKKSAHSSLCTY